MGFKLNDSDSNIKIRMLYKFVWFAWIGFLLSRSWIWVFHRLIKVMIRLGKSQLYGHTQCIGFIPSFNTVFLFGIIIAWTWGFFTLIYFIAIANTRTRKAQRQRQSLSKASLILILRLRAILSMKWKYQGQNIFTLTKWNIFYSKKMLQIKMKSKRNF